ncbi:putative GNAT family acetyltransferase [Hypoxylon rubiginosum]|uniref:GNAT family acetyltransferase n=1 Tax=Hypoxylon rubiginosum TaxID=110542 RepID=A0ACC0CNI8_9PEZI|nr:putative GNAT family acetyltransferase [Hypoxylon rubiginosum]
MPNTKPFDPFHSERLIYRAVDDTPEDEAFVHSIQRDAEAQSGASYGLLRPESKKASNEFKLHIAEKCLLGAIICLPPSNDKEPAGEPVGIIILKSNPPHLAHHRWTEISIDVAREHRGKGFGGEAIRWALWYSFQIAGLHRVQLGAFSFNEGAMKLYAKLGFKEEGRQRDFMWFNGGWHDSVMYGMLEDEWREIQRKAGKEV